MTIYEFCKQFEFKPHNIKLFKKALTHSTYSNENRGVGDYQRLEFLGDAILSLAASHKIFLKFPKYDEGAMSLFKASLVSSKSLANLTLTTKLVDLIKVGNSLKNVKENQKILADVFESFVAAIFLDQGFEVVKKFLNKTLFKNMKKIDNEQLKNPKTILQEHLQSNSRKIIEYVTKQEIDFFCSNVLYDNLNLGTGQGKTKQEAEVNAAKDALSKVNKNHKKGD